MTPARDPASPRRSGHADEELVPTSASHSSEMPQEVTIHQAYQGLDDYLAEQASTLDPSSGLTKLFAGADPTLLGTQPSLGADPPAPEPEPPARLPVRTSGTYARSRARKRTRELGEKVPALATGQTSVRRSKTGRTQQERSAALRRRLLDATVDCLVRYGYAGTTTTRVTELAGVTRGAQMHHFPTRADLVAAAVRHLADKRAELAFDKIDDVRRAPDPLDAALEVLWEIHQGPIHYATIEMWVAARTDPELREQLTSTEPTARAALIEFAEAAFGDYAKNPRFRHIMYTALDAVRGILVMSMSDEDATITDRRWRRAKADLLELMTVVLMAKPDRQ
jgi:AcrR family transcriptional regulator